MIWVTDAKAMPQYRIWLQFSDGKTGDVDLKDFLFSDARAIVAELRDANAFAALHVDMDTVVWSNGFDLAPEFLCSHLVEYVAA